MSLVYEVYSYWNIQELQGTFNAIASLTNSANFTGLLRVLALIAILSLALAVLAGRARHEDFWRWVVMVALVNGMMLVPKANVILVDKTGTEPNRTVANVPIGLAVLAHGTSRIGDWLTRAYETVFSLPNDLQFQKRGLMFGHRILEETQVMSTDMASGTWQRDFQEYMRECVVPDLISGHLSIDTLRNSTNLWAALGNTNPALYVTLSTVGTVQCAPTAYNDLTNRLNNAVVPAVITSYGLKLFPGDPLANAKTQNAIVTAYSHGLGIASTATEIVKQATIQSAFVQAYCGVFAQAGDSNRAALCYSVGMGAYQTNQTYQVLAKIAESSMPKLKSAIEIIQYSVFPIILAFAIVAGHLSIRVLKTYGLSLIWIQLWPPLYAVVHYIMTVKMQTYQNALGAAAATLQGSGQLVSMAVSDQAVAGMLVVAIPPIAAALVKGGEVGLQAVAGLVSAPRTAERQAADIAKGNESVGQFRTAGTVDYSTTPTPVLAQRGADGSYTYTHPDGSTTFNVSTAMDRASFRVSSAGREARSLTQQSEAVETAAISQTLAAGKEIAAAYSRVGDFVRSHGKGSSSGTGFTDSDAARISAAFTEAQDIARRFAQKHGLSEEQATQVLGSVQASVGLEAFGNGVTAQAKFVGNSKAAESIGKDKEEAFKEAKAFQQAMERVRQVAREEKFNTGETSEAKAMRGVRASLDEARRQSDQAAANWQQSLAYKELAGYAREGSLTVDQDLTTRIMDRLATERATIDGHTYNGFRRDEVDALMRMNNPEMRALVDRIANEETAKLLQERYGNLKTPEDVRAFFKQGLNQVDDREGVAAQGRQWLGDVRQQGLAAGVNPDKNVTSKLPGRVRGQIGKVDADVNRGQGLVAGAGQGLQGFVEKELDNPSVAARAASNAGEAILPKGSTYLLDKIADAAPGSFAQRTAKTYEGTAWEAALETGLFAVTTFWGGPVAGRAAGKAAGPWLGRKSGDEAAEKILKENATTKEGYNFPGLTGLVADKERREAIEKVTATTMRDGRILGVGAGAVAGNYAAENWQKPIQLFQAAWQQGEQWASGLLPGQPMQPVQQPMRQEAAQPVRQEAVQPMQPMQQPMRQEAAQPMQPGLGVAESMLAGAGNVFTSPLGTSNIGKLFGSQKTMPPPAQPVEAEQSSIKAEDLPKPR